jgi:hypothetical protein
MVRLNLLKFSFSENCVALIPLWSIIESALGRRGGGGRE